MRSPLALGAPGVYPVPDEPVRALTGVRMDVAAFVGVAPRGPARIPAFQAPWADPPRGPANPTASLRSVAVPVDSWNAYRRLYGGFEGPGLLPYAVAAFFENGGRRAYVVRIVHDYGEGAAENGWGTAVGVVPGATVRGGGALSLVARNEGTWGNGLRAQLSFRTRPLSFDETDWTPEGLTVLPDVREGPGSLLRFWLPGGVPVLRFVTASEAQWRPDKPVLTRTLVLESALPGRPDRAEIVEASLYVTDDASDVGRAEMHEGLGLGADHPRFIAAQLWRDSSLVYPDARWVRRDVIPSDPFLRPIPDVAGAQFGCGRDRFAAITPDDFFDDAWDPGDEEPRGGIQALAENDEVAVLVVPDLYSPGPLPARTDVPAPTAGPEFETCIPERRAPLPPPPEPCPAPPDPPGALNDVLGLRLDPLDPTDRKTIETLQQRAIDFTELLGRWVVLLDAPPGLAQRQILAWRARFGSAWAAGYHPWLRASRPDDAREGMVSVPPSAFAAGILAAQEIAFGVQHGPANLLATGVVAVTDRVSPQRHGELHQSAVNVFAPERDGFRLSAGRTLSLDPQWRQLSVRRLVSMLRRALLRQMQWTVFEPNDARLRDELTRLLDGYLRSLFRAGAFRGRTPAQGYFVRCDESVNPPQIVDEGKLICLVGIAPVEPLEFILLRLSRDGDGTLLMES
jgi:hypothetical protein